MASERDDLFRAGRLGLGGRARCRLADEDACAARRLAQTFRVERSQQLERLDAVEPILAAALREHLQLVVGLGKCPALERDADLVRPRRRGELDLLQTRVDTIERTVLHLIVELHVFFAADHRLVNQLVVERDHERVLELHPVAPDMGRHVGDIDGVFAVRGQIDAGENPSARAQRKAGDVGQLRARLGAERPPAGPRIGFAERLHGDAARRDHILLDERRRHLQAGRDVVEAVHDVIGGQHARGIEVDGEEIANRIRVLLAIEPVQHDRVRHVRLTGGLVERRLEPGDERIGCRRHQAAAIRAAASRVHAACARPSRTHRRAGRCSEPSSPRS